MLSIQQEPIGYSVRATAPGMGWKPLKWRVDTLAELHLTIDHHFGKDHDRAACPLCARHLKPKKVTA